MKPALGQITEVVGLMVTEGVVATVEVEVADSEEETREDIKLSPSFLLKIHNILITLEGYWQSSDHG